jgi:hypothetical protein
MILSNLACHLQAQTRRNGGSKMANTQGQMFSLTKRMPYQIRSGRQTHTHTATNQIGSPFLEIRLAIYLLNLPLLRFGNLPLVVTQMVSLESFHHLTIPQA